MEAMLEGRPYPIRALITSNNPLAQWPNQNRARAAVAALDLVVHLELFRNATSRFADYVLPMASGIEKGGTTRFAEDRRIVWNDRFIDPPGEARSDHWFWIELGKRFGFDDVLKEDYKNPRKLWDEVLLAATPELAAAGSERITRLPNRTVRLPVFDGAPGEIDPVYVTERMRADPDANLAYPTASGRLEFWTPAQEEKFQAMGLSALPQFYSEAEQLVDLPHIEYDAEPRVSSFLGDNTLVHGGRIVDASIARDPAFDTELVTGRPNAPHFHSWTHYYWQAQEMWPEIYCQIHPQKAATIGVEDGDAVSIRTVNGKITVRAWIHRGIRPNCVFVPIGWDEQQPYHPGASVNHLTGVRLDPISQQANLKTHLCRVEKA
jgi:anaerobic selenocysteine-containing dehydrogenase